MMRILFIDDDYLRYLSFVKNNPNQDITWVQTDTAAIQTLEHDLFDVIFFDHDLGENMTTMSIVDWMIQSEDLHYKFDVMHHIFIHSANPVGANNLKFKLTNVFDEGKITIVYGAWEKYFDFDE